MNPLGVWKTARRDRAIRRAFGTSHPGRLTLPGSDCTLHVDPYDERARKILLYAPLRGRRKPNQAFWRLAVRSFDPTLCADVGLNYGECLLGTRYPEGCRGYGFEANGGLFPYLSKSHAGHAQKDRIELHEAAVSDVDGRELSFVVDERWSGGSHLAAAGEAGNRTVTTVTLDSVLPRPDAGARVLFKVDVEGFEPAVLRGMDRTLGAAGSALGFVEFDPAMMSERGADVAGYWDWLAARFELFECKRVGEARPLTAAAWPEAEAQIASRHFDLICFRGDAALRDRLLSDWRAEA